MALTKQGDIKELEKIQKRATKLVINFKKIPYKDRLIHLKLPTLKYRRLRGDMIEVFKITHNIYDPEVLPELRYYPKSNTRGIVINTNHSIISFTTIHESILFLPV